MQNEMIKETLKEMNEQQQANCKGKVKSIIFSIMELKSSVSSDLKTIEKLKVELAELQTPETLTLDI